MTRARPDHARLRALDRLRFDDRAVAPVAPDRKRQIEQSTGMELAAPGIECPLRQRRCPASSTSKPMPPRSRAKSSRARRSGLPTGSKVTRGMSVMGSIDLAPGRKGCASSGAANRSCGTAPRPAPSCADRYKDRRRPASAAHAHPRLAASAAQVSRDRYPAASACPVTARPS